MTYRQQELRYHRSWGSYPQNIFDFNVYFAECQVQSGHEENIDISKEIGRQSTPC